MHAVLLAFSLLVSLPTWTVVGSGIGARAEGDLALWHEGAVFVADTVAHDRGALLHAARATLVGVGVFALLALPLSAGLFATLHTGRDLGARGFAAAAARRTQAFFVVLVLFGIGLALCAGAGALAVSKVYDAFAETPDPRKGIWLAGLTAVPFLVGALLWAAAADVARSGLSNGHVGTVRTLFACARLALLHPLRFGAPYVAFGAASLGLTLVAAAIASKLGGRPGPAGPALFVVGHATLVARAFLRAGWMSAATRLARWTSEAA